MTDITITLPEHGDADWDVALGEAFDTIVTQVNLNTASIGSGGTITADSITDATTVGKALLRAANAAAALSAIGAASASGLTAAAAVAAAAIPASQLGVPSGVATLNSSGQIPDAQIPAIAITDFLGSVANQTAMLALTGQKGDFCLRSDSGTMWVITGTPTTTLGSWTQLTTAAPVTTVAGRTGAVTLTESDIASLTADLAARVLTTRTVAGHALSADVTLAVADVSGAAPTASPTFTGDPKAPTPATSDNDTSIATTAWVNAQLRIPLPITQTAYNALVSAGTVVTGQNYWITGP